MFEEEDEDEDEDEDAMKSSEGAKEKTNERNDASRVAFPVRPRDSFWTVPFIRLENRSDGGDENARQPTGTKGRSRDER